MEPSRTKKMVEKPSVKKAPSGLSQKLSCSYQTWRPTSRRSLSPWNDPVVGVEASGRSGSRRWSGRARRAHATVRSLDRAHLTAFSLGSTASLVRCR